MHALAAKGEIIIVGSGAMRGSGIIQGEWYLVKERKRARGGFRDKETRRRREI